MFTSMQPIRSNPAPRLFAAAGALAGPLCLVSLVTVVIGASTGGDSAAFLASPIAVASSICFLAAMLAMSAAVVATLLRAAPGAGTAVPAFLALMGSIVVAGGAWANLFVLPGLAAADPRVLEHGIPSIQLVYVVSFFAVAVGWASLAIMQLIRRTAPRWIAVVTLVGALLALLPAPDAARMLVLTVAVSFAAVRQLTPRRRGTAAAEPAPGSRRAMTAADN